ncbi:hypothetical protein [uncultured Thiocystis sp.]|jgi:hypothetical protein|uniref:hypothetical protein n=1 Tax=uncultured Thiocystis sp. TaxID=1202134 RepID=UPI0025E24B58|nr:hypothetical protein [uncultured Thiocystis sp.]
MTISIDTDWILAVIAFLSPVAVDECAAVSDTTGGEYELFRRAALKSVKLDTPETGWL